VEGFIIGFFNIACAIAAVMLATWAPKMKVRLPSVDACWTFSWAYHQGDWRQDEGSRSFAVTGCLVTFAFFFYQIFSMYRLKNRWYMRI
jgi:hypothetical protein